MRGEKDMPSPCHTAAKDIFADAFDSFEQSQSLLTSFPTPSPLWQLRSFSWRCVIRWAFCTNTTMTSHTPHRTPLRRVSQGSLFALSQHNPDAPHGLGFIEPVMSELVDEAEALHANVDNLRRLSDSLRSFNESFASWLYVMDMNALTTDWLQVRASRQIADSPRWMGICAGTDGRVVPIGKEACWYVTCLLLGAP